MKRNRAHMRKAIVAALMLATALAAPAKAYTIVGPGGRSCSEWLAADGDMKALMLSWVGGYVTAAHLELASDPGLVEEVITAYCKSNPRSRLKGGRPPLSR